jgi:hypothetical protein
MVDIVLLYFLVKHIGKLAEQKGQPTSTWKIFTILGWVIGGMFGLYAGLLYVNLPNFTQLLKPQFSMLLLQVMLFYFVGGLTIYFLLRGLLQRMPDQTPPTDNPSSFQ